MLNFCPDLKSIVSDLRKVHGEFIFLIDRSGSMSGVNINRVKVNTLSSLSVSPIYRFMCDCPPSYEDRHTVNTFTKTRHENVLAVLRLLLLGRLSLLPTQIT